MVNAAFLTAVVSAVVVSAVDTVSEWVVDPADACAGEAPEYLTCVLNRASNFRLTRNQPLAASTATKCGSQKTLVGPWSDVFVLGDGGASATLTLSDLVIDGVEQNGKYCAPYVHVVDDTSECPKALPVTVQPGGADFHQARYHVDYSSLSLDSAKTYYFVVDLTLCDPGASAFLSYIIDVHKVDDTTSTTSTANVPGDGAAAASTAAAATLALAALTAACW